MSEKKAMMWMNGVLIEQDKPLLPFMTHALHYGSGVFEGIRIYDTPKGKAVFRLREHMVRFLDSAKVMCMKHPYSVDDLVEATRLTVRNTIPNADYIRPLAWYGENDENRIVLNPFKFKVNVAIACAHMGVYMGKESMENGAKLITSSWTKPANTSTSLQAKICGNYVNSILAKIESNQLGADEALMLNTNGTVAEGPGENIFMIKNGKIYTPPLSSGVLEGITKDSVVTIARDKGYQVIEKEMTRSEIYMADEFFMTGTAAEVTPIRSLDERTIGCGKRGPVTKDIQEAFFEAARGKDPRYLHWLTLVD
jgi:branched-chain amino acid aminotransferase